MTKRAFDIFFASLALILLLPILLVTVIIIWITMGRPILYKQVRPGLNCSLFTIYKFRTMNNNRDENDNLISDDQRRTALGSFLRKTSLDEIPELFNVLRGDMSLVGPRPLLTRYVSRYTPEQNRRHEVLPGITGLSQISGRDDLVWTERFKVDVQYVDNHNIFLDIKILLITIWKVMFRDDINETAEGDFWGELGPPKGGPSAIPSEADETNEGC